MPLILNGDGSIGPLSATEMGYLDGITSAVQGQINGKLTTPGAWQPFTPTIAGELVAGTGTYTLQDGLYTAVGKLIVFSLRIRWTNHTGGSGQMLVSGLPVMCKTQYSPISLVLDGVSSPASTIIQAMVRPNTTTIAFYSYPVAGGTLSSLAIDTAGEIFASGTYEAV